MKSSYKLAALWLGALLLRLILMQVVQHPGIADPNHYYNMGIRLVNGHGFTIDYIWQYALPPESIVHPEEHWMPLAAVLAAAPMALFGIGVHSALIPFVVLGSLLPLLSYWAARQLDLSESAALFAGAATAVLPELVLNSVRTDTTVPAAFFTGVSLLLLTHGLRRGAWWSFVISGAAAGLAYLTRSDALLIAPMLAVVLLVHALWRRDAPLHLRWVWLMPLVALLVVSPWLARNLNAFGTPTTPESGSMFFFTHHDDHYAYEREFSLETLLASQTPAEILGKRVFEALAAVKLMYTTLDVVLPVAVVGGLILLLAARDRRRLLALSPALILLLGAFVAYTVFLPYKAQAGSFKKIYLSLVPLLIPLGAHAFERAIGDRRLRLGAMSLTLIFTGANAVELVRADANFTVTYLRSMEQIAEHAADLPDINGDDALVLMAQDPYMLRYVGIQSVMYPYEPRDTIYAVAGRYGVDYLLMPPNRPALNALYDGTETDPRFVPAHDIPGTQYRFFAVMLESGS